MKKNERPMNVTVSNDTELSAIKKLSVCMGVPEERVIAEVIRRMSQKEGTAFPGREVRIG